MKRSNSLGSLLEAKERQLSQTNSLVELKPTSEWILGKDAKKPRLEVVPPTIQMGNDTEDSKKDGGKDDKKAPTPEKKPSASDDKSSNTGKSDSAPKKATPKKKAAKPKSGDKKQQMEIPLPMLLQMMGAGGSKGEAEAKDDADINAPDANGQTPLHLFVKNGWNELIPMALLTGADPGVKDKEGNNVFHLAAKENKPLALLTMYETLIKLSKLAEKSEEKSSPPVGMYI